MCNAVNEQMENQMAASGEIKVSFHLALFQTNQDLVFTCFHTPAGGTPAPTTHTYTHMYKERNILTHIDKKTHVLILTYTCAHT